MGNKPKDAIVLFTKTPLPGKVKQRLRPVLGPLETCKLYSCFIKDISSMIKELPGVDYYISYTPAQGKDYFCSIVPKGKTFLQKRSSLGGKLFYALSTVFERNRYRSVGMIFGDAPDIPKAYFKDSFAYLKGRGRRVVVGPCRDGGCYYIGVNSPEIACFIRSIPWDKTDAVGKVLQAIKAGGYAYKMLPLWYDIDTPAGLFRLLSRLDTLRNDGMLNTRKFLMQLISLRDSRSLLPEGPC